MTGPRPAEPVRLSDDELGSLAVALVVGELQWTPDVAPLVMDRISRDAVAYPDHFDRRTGVPAGLPEPPAEVPSFGRTLRRVVIFASIALLVADSRPGGGHRQRGRSISGDRGRRRLGLPVVPSRRLS